VLFSMLVNSFHPARIFWTLIVCVLAIGPGGCGKEDAAPSSAGPATTKLNQEVATLRLTRQFGIGYLPLTIVEQGHYIEQIAREQGLGDIQVSWSQLGSGASSTDALLSGSVDFTAMGVAPLIMVWAKSNGDVKGVVALGCAPMYFNSTNPNVKSVRDLTDKDRIALPAVKVSIQAVALQMSATQAFGADQFAKLDKLTVSMKHPDAVAALLSGKSEITGHVTNDPYVDQELADQGIHTVWKSYDLVGGPHTHALVATTKTFHDSNPRTYAVVLAAIERAQELINRDKATAAELYLKSGETKESAERIIARLNDPTLIFNSTPKNVMKFADFMLRTGTVKTSPPDWKDLFFPEIAGKLGS
jgi:NitT/TauT family transport system substrate-binding protein